MENNYPGFSYKSIFAVLGVLFLAGITGAVVYRVTQGESFSFSFAQNPIDETTELGLLEEYYSKNNVPLPENYKGLTTASHEFKITILKPAIVKRELIWKSGAIVAVGYTSENESKVNFQLDNYRQKIASSTKSLKDVFEIFDQIKADQVFGSALDSNVSGAFGPITKKSRAFPDGKIHSEFWSSPSGIVSEIYNLKDKSQYVFFVVADSNDRGYETYEEWLKAAFSEY